MKPPLFLARESYRRRRVRDAARILPLVGAVLFLLPMLWAGTGRTTGGFGFIFIVWFLLIVAAALVARASARVRGDEVQPDDEEA